MKHGCSNQLSHVSSIVDGDESSIVGGYPRYDGLHLKLIASRECFVAKLDDVNSTGQGRMQEALKIAASPPSICTQI
jgi:hypothetical protein